MPGNIKNRSGGRRVTKELNLSVKHLTKYFGCKTLTEITTQDFLKYRTLRLTYVKPATINRELSCLLRMLNLAIKSDDFSIHKNPLSGIKQLKEAPVENRTLEIHEYHKLLNAAEEYFRRIILFACNTGMRKMEILNLRFGQIKMLVNNAEIELTDTKSGDKEFVPLNVDVINLLDLIAGERGIDLRNMSREDKGKYVFLGKYGKRIGSVRKPMANTFAEAGVELKPFHTFRQIWTKMMFEAGNDPYTIQEVGRWRDFETMLKYCYTTRPQQHVAVNKLSQQLNRNSGKILKAVAI